MMTKIYVPMPLSKGYEPVMFEGYLNKQLCQDICDAINNKNKIKKMRKKR
jgi:hypothetical protein